MIYNGKIKCTYVELFDGSNSKLFSLQQSDFGNANIFQAEEIQKGGLTRAKLTNEALQVIYDKMAKDDRREELVTFIYNNGVYVKSESVKWDNPLLLIAAIALLSNLF